VFGREHLSLKSDTLFSSLSHATTRITRTWGLSEKAMGVELQKRPTFPFELKDITLRQQLVAYDALIGWPYKRVRTCFTRHMRTSFHD
jgi:hypothetical protein